VARGREALAETANELRTETGRQIEPVPVDTNLDESVKAMVERVQERFGRIDILVNCAAAAGGSAPVPKLPEITGDLFFADMNVKVMGYLRCAREVAPHMEREGWGRIINISGLAARQSGTMRNVAVVALTKNLADDLGPKGINVTVVHPGMTRTEAVAARWAAQAEREGVALAEIERRQAEGTSIKRVIDAADIANVVAFLASPKSVAINGDVIAAGGGAPRSIYY
jgi:NAD(P)-dependent dehydrogenase (short-subunit alcohol dehydrogenase family)